MLVSNWEPCNHKNSHDRTNSSDSRAFQYIEDFIQRGTGRYS